MRVGRLCLPQLFALTCLAGLGDGASQQQWRRCQSRKSWLILCLLLALVSFQSGAMDSSHSHNGGDPQRRALARLLCGAATSGEMAWPGLQVWRYVYQPEVRRA
jgi:hypothetical protein